MTYVAVVSILFFSFRDNNSQRDYQEQDSGGNVEIKQCHVFSLTIFATYIATPRNIAVDNAPKRRVNHWILPAAVGMKTPTTSDPKIIFALSSKKFERIFNCSRVSMFLLS